MFKILAALLAAVLVGCGSAKEDFNSGRAASDRSLEIPVGERTARLPNQLFVAVWNQNPDEVLQLAKTNPSLLESRNTQGDTALGMALREGLYEVASRLLSITPVKNLRELNSGGESYVYLASRAGFADLITRMADSYYNSFGSFQIGPWENYEFSDLDQPDAEGRRALFVAANRQVAEALEIQYYRGLMEYPFWKFSMREDNSSEVFLHKAAEEGREDVILWASERICKPGSWEASPSAWFRWPAQAIQYGLRTLQTNVIGDWHLPSDLLFNRRDTNGQTPLQVAITQRQWGSVRALASCRWLDYDLANSDGQTALHSFLRALNPYAKSVDPEAKEAFEFLLSQTTHVRVGGVASRVNAVDSSGASALHVAASLGDPFFYRLMEKFGDVYLLNGKGESARNIFFMRQQQVSRAQ